MIMLTSGSRKGYDYEKRIQSLIDDMKEKRYHTEQILFSDTITAGTSNMMTGRLYALDEFIAELEGII